PRDLNIKIDRMVKIRNNGVLLESSSNMDRLLSSTALKNVKLEARKPEKFWPRVTKHGASSDVSEEDTVGFTSEELEGTSTPEKWCSKAFKLKTGNSRVSNWVVELHPTAWKHLVPTVSDRKGPLLEELILANDLQILNVDGSPPTFESLNGKSFIDLTLAPTNFVARISDWEVLSDVSSSDHRPISFAIRCASPCDSSFPELSFVVRDFEEEEVLPQLAELTNHLLHRFPVLVAPRVIDQAIDEFYVG
ncbi:Exo endo phos 2 domain containing protein, partial [Asbolus verrucosus]